MRLARPGAGLLLDLDGTLVDSEPVHQAAFREYFARRGWQVEDAVIGLFSGRRAQEVFPTLAGPWTGEDPAVLTAAVIDLELSSPLRPQPVAGAARLIAACTRAGLPAAVVTSAERGWTAHLLGLLDGSAMAAVTAEDCMYGKPDPEPFRRGAELLGRRAGDLLAVEDSPAGIASARGAGIGHVIGVTTTQPGAVLRTAGAHETAPDLRALAAVVERLGPRS